MPCERCGSYADECPCVWRAERENVLQALGYVVTLSVNDLYVRDAAVWANNYASRMLAERMTDDKP